MTLAKSTHPNQAVYLPTLYEDPKDIIQRATAWATHLMDVVDKKQMYATIQGKKYLEVQAWQLIGAFARTDAIPSDPEPIVDKDGNTTGYEVRTVLLRDGGEVGAGVMSCGLDSFPCQGKEGSEKHKAAMSAAQTWSISKAYRNKYGFVAQLAGFEPTTAEEMAGGALTVNLMIVCPHHQTEWFKRGAMKEPAHPVEGATGPRGGKVWCNQGIVLEQLSARLRVLARSLKWNDSLIDDWGEKWKGMNPTEKLDAITQLETVNTGADLR